METLTITEKDWGHSRAVGGQLLNPEGKMCCLGFYCRQLLNYQDSDILGQLLPTGVGFTTELGRMKWLRTPINTSELLGVRNFGSDSTTVEHVLAYINDCEITEVIFEEDRPRDPSADNPWLSNDLFMKWKRLLISFLFLKYGGINVVFE